MSFMDYFLPELDQEMAKTRKVLAAVPEDRFDYKPHPKSFAMGPLASHVAQMSGWAVQIMGQDSLDIAPPGEPPMQVETAKTSKELLAMLDKNVAEGRAAIAGATDENLAKPWSLLAGGRLLFTMPRSTVLRSMMLNHIIHHRAQLTVYLRLNEVAVPGMYGPSADEMPG